MVPLNEGTVPVERPAWSPTHVEHSMEHRVERRACRDGTLHFLHLPPKCLVPSLDLPLVAGPGVTNGAEQERNGCETALISISNHVGCVRLQFRKGSRGLN